MRLLIRHCSQKPEQSILLDLNNVKYINICEDTGKSLKLVYEDEYIKKNNDVFIIIDTYQRTDVEENNEKTEEKKIMEIIIFLLKELLIPFKRQ